MKQRGATPEEDRARGFITEGPIKDVTKSDDPWMVTQESGWGCVVRDYGVEPKVGDVLTIFGQLGYSFHGQAINGEMLWYETPEEERQKQADAIVAFSRRHES